MANLSTPKIVLGVGTVGDKSGKKQIPECQNTTAPQDPPTMNPSPLWFFKFPILTVHSNRRPMGQILQACRRASIHQHLPQSRLRRARHGAHLLATRARYQRAAPGSDGL